MTRKEYTKLNAQAENGTLDDTKNPIFALCSLDTGLLSQVIKGEIDLQELAKREMENRGRNVNGEWVGFKHEIK